MIEGGNGDGGRTTPADIVPREFEYAGRTRAENR